MSFVALMKIIAAKHLGPGEPKPLRTRTPMLLSQDSAVSISITPLVLAEAEGALFKSDLPLEHKISAVGQMSLFGMTLIRAYLSNTDGAFIHFATRGQEILETRLYRPYDELYPDDWAFWLADADGYIGYPVMQSKDGDGGIQYQRSWSPSPQRIDPAMAIESVVGATGFTTTMRHRMMHYSRALKDSKLAEHLLVSAVETDTAASVNFWLGIDVAASDLTVFAAADAPPV